MILINNKTKESYSNVSKAEAARMMCIGSGAIYDWINNNKEPFEVFNNWTLYFNETKLKQVKGFALK